jgi:hypothetical protein
VQGAVILGHAFEAAAVGLEFLQLVARRIVTVRAPADVQLLEVALEGDFLFVVAGTAGGDGGVALDAFLSGG